jgi:DNA polymerase-1
VKLRLSNTDLQCERLLSELDEADTIGFDTESAGPLLRNRKWKEGRTFLNIYKSTMVGFSVAFENQNAYYVPIAHNKKNAPYDYIDEILRRVVGKHVWSHNIKHDAKVLRLEGYPLPARWYDSYLAAWLARGQTEGNGLKQLAADILARESPEFDTGFYNLTGKQALQYACHDALNTLELGQYFTPQLEANGLLEHFTNVECPFALVLADMEFNGMGVDEQSLRSLSADCRGTMEAIAKSWDARFPGISITSSAQLQDLFETGTWKRHGKTASGQNATTREAIEYQLEVCPEGSDGYEAARMRLEYQSASKVATTYTLGYIEESRQFPDRRLHGDYKHLGARTGRLAASNPNLQNVPVRSELGRRVKEAFIPRDGYVFLSADYSQIELRVLAHLAGGALARAYKNNEDVHQQTADACGCDRDKGKTVNFALQYGCSPTRLASILGIGRKEAVGVRRRLMAVYPELDRLKTALVEAADSRAPEPYIKTLTGRKVYIPQLMSMHQSERAAGERKAINACVQGSAFDIMKIGMVNARRALAEAGMLNNTVYCVNNLHDEVTYEVHEDHVDAVVKMVKLHLENAFKLRVPLVAEPKVGRNWLETK